MTQQELRSLLNSAGLPAFMWQLPDLSYETCSEQFVRENWSAWLASRPAELVTSYDCGGGMMRQIPRWIENAGDCDNLALGTMAWADCGNALAARRRGVTRGGLGYGVLFYQAGPARSDNYQVSGGHSINWFVELGTNAVRFFESGMGEIVNPSPIERMSASFGLAA